MSGLRDRAFSFAADSSKQRVVTQQPAVMPVPDPVQEPIDAEFPARTVSLGGKWASRRILFVGDAVVSSGFAKATHKVCDGLAARYDVHLLGLHHNGDSDHGYRYPIYTTWEIEGGDVMGQWRLPRLARRLQPDAVIVQQDVWNFPSYGHALQEAGIEIPLIGTMPVDGKFCRGAALRHLSLANFWTQFGVREAQLGGYTGAHSVIPLGVDTELFQPMSKADALEYLELPSTLRDAFVVGFVGRNQPRKRLDLLIAYFCDWVKAHHRDDAFLYLHYAPTGENIVDAQGLMAYYGLADRLILAEPPLGRGSRPEAMRATYCCMDVHATCASEGWGLTHIESMACGIPQIVPDFAALGDWPGSSVVKVACPTMQALFPFKVNTVVGIPDRGEFVAALERLYVQPSVREMYADLALRRARSPEFDWDVIGIRWCTLMEEFLQEERDGVHVGR